MKFSLIFLLFFLPFCTTNFAVISDIHYDMYYSEGSPSKCFLGDTGMGCCRYWSIPINGSFPAPKYGTFGCDSPKDMIDIVITWLHNLDVDYLVHLGDIIDHDLFLQSSEYMLKEIETIASDFKKLPFPVFSILGNHDGIVIGNLWDNSFGQDWLDKVQSRYGLPTNLTRGGYYSVEMNNYTAIFLNCLGYDTYNIEIMMYPEKDLFNQSAWLLDQIEINKNLNRNIFIFNHFGSDVGEATTSYNNMISNLNYSNIFYFAGHSHFDDIYFMNSSFFFIHPSIVPDSHFPEIRVYMENNGIVHNYIQYGLNLTTLEFIEIYRAKESYDMIDMSFTSWKDFFNRKEKNQTLSDLFNYHQNWGF